MSQVQDKAFKKLKKEWYRKLKKEGFVDIEKAEHSLGPFYSCARRFDVGSRDEVAEVTNLKYDAKEEYYRLAEHFLNEFEFDNKIEKIIWTMHTEGKTIREISSLKKIKMKKDKVHEVIKRLASEMKKLYGVTNGKE